MPAASHAEFPPPPWRLRGQAVAAGWLVRGPEPVVEPPPGWRALRLGPWRLIGAVWARYEGGDLSYSELAVGLVVRRGAALAISIRWIWVDSEASRLGGRALWAIPKQLASFRGEGGVFTAQTPLGPASLEDRPGPRLGRLLQGFATAQPDGDRTVIARCRVRASVRLAPTTWQLPIPGLARRPLASFRLEDADLTFGE